VNWFDIITLLVVIAGVLWGSSRGTVREVLSLGGLIFSLFLAGLTYVWFGNVIGLVVTPHNDRHFLGFGLALLVFSPVVWSVLDRSVRGRFLLPFGFIDKLVGGAIGGFEGAVAMAAVAALFVVYPVWSLALGPIESTAAPDLVERLSFVFSILPAAFDSATALLLP
jgi:uncharacterized membrane protein required for colicin V production